MLKYLSCQRNYFHVRCTKFAGYGAEDTATSHLTSIVQQNACVVIEANVRTVGATDFLLRANDQSL